MLTALGVMLVPALASALAVTVYEQDFETVQSGWGIGTYGGGEIEFADGSSAPAAFPTRSLLLSHIPENTSRLTGAAPSSDFSIPRTEDQLYQFQFDLRVSRTDMNVFTYIQDRNFTGQLVLLMRFTPAGDLTIDYNNGSANVSETFISGYEANTTYTVTYTTNPSTNQFSATVSGSAVTLDNVGFRKTLGGDDIFQNFNNVVILNDGGAASGADFDLYFDNFRISTVPEPRHAALFLGMILPCLIWLRRKLR